jgi:uncharacterized protein YkwD
MSRVVATMAFLLVWGGAFSAMSRCEAQMGRRYVVPRGNYRYVQPTTYQQVQPVTYRTVQPVTYAAQPATYTVQPTSYTASQPASYTAAQSYGDPYGFTGWLNSVRASYGLAAVGYDANLESWAAANNAQQAARGLGHFVMGPARRQNSAIGNSATIGAQWMASPAHRAGLLDPTITRIGLAGNGQYWTFNAY